MQMQKTAWEAKKYKHLDLRLRPFKFLLITAKCRGRTGWNPGFRVWESEEGSYWERMKALSSSCDTNVSLLISGAGLTDRPLLTSAKASF